MTLLFFTLMNLNVSFNQSYLPTDLHYCTAQFTPRCDFFITLYYYRSNSLASDSRNVITRQAVSSQKLLPPFGRQGLIMKWYPNNVSVAYCINDRIGQKRRREMDGHTNYLLYTIIKKSKRKQNTCLPRYSKSNSVANIVFNGRCLYLKSKG